MSSKSNYLFRIDIIFAIGIAIFFIVLALTLKSSREVIRGRESEERSYSIIREMDQLLSNVLSVETGSRGFAISGNDEFLLSLVNGKDSLKSVVDSLRKLMVDREQGRRLDTLDVLINRKLSYSDSIVTMRRTQGIDSTLDYISKGEGKKIMDALQNTIGRAINEELVLLQTRSAITVGKRVARGTYFAILSCVAVIVMIAAFGVIRDSTRKLLENKKVQEQLIDELTNQNKQLDDFTHIITHNIRGPANNIVALVGMVDNNSPISEVQLIFSKLEKVSKNLIDTLNDLLDMLNVKSTTPEKVELNFEQVLLKERDNVQGEISKTNAQLMYDFTDAPSIEYSKVYLESIFHNLIGNALKYRSPERNPIIQIKTERREGHIFLYVSDNGVGIDMSRYGEKLFGLRRTFHNHPEARGIGLFMTKTQIESLGGKITAQSVVDKGTTFTVRF
ncbi:MAG TPA: CHASE3 domain-containing protein [Cyclobacteriaceae bacterium]|nr:CHASE3 domain-containing protein [Cyclobacteriaceae bacterium]